MIINNDDYDNSDNENGDVHAVNIDQTRNKARKCCDDRKSHYIAISCKQQVIIL